MSSGNLLTQREREVLQLICQEKTSAEIAHVLKVSVRTIDRFRSKILIKTGARSIVGMVVFAIENSVIELSK